ncbi:flippase [Bacillus sp. B15-48]|uniref:flippase n=1 Tax=Bacillus sp. B15-48 TaxID=1548601 RepID=UPI00193F413E|nr:flippase [Bacillus sp. B15-48]MBM4761456.1 oligosaccharide flippase family protein [Bacillus sp. B15-48]
MSIRKSKAFGPIVLLGAQYFTRVIGPLISLLLVRYLGPEDYGLYASAIAVTSFLTFLPDFGLQQSVLKISASSNIRLNSLIKSSLYTSLLYTIITLIFLISWLSIFQYEFTIKIIAYILSIAFFRIAFSKIITTLLQINREYTRIAIWNLIITSIQWIATLVCMVLKANLFTIVFWPQFLSLLISIIMFIVEGNKINLFNNLNPFKEKGEYKKLITNSLEFGTANSMYQMYHRSDAMILSASRNPIEVGYYTVAFKIAELIYFFAGVLFNQVLYPLFFKWSKHDRDKYFRFYRLLNKLMILIGFFAAALVLLFSDEIVYIIYGSHEIFVSTLLTIMMFAVPFRFLVVSIGAILTTDNLVRKRIKIQSKVAVINIGSNALFVPIYGAVAAAILMVITDVILMIGYLFATNKHVTKKHISKRILYQIPILLGLAGIAFYMSGFDLMYKVIAGAIIMIVFIFIGLFSLEKEEITEIKSFFKTKGR